MSESDNAPQAGHAHYSHNIMFCVRTVGDAPGQLQAVVPGKVICSERMIVPHLRQYHLDLSLLVLIYYEEANCNARSLINSMAALNHATCEQDLVR